MVKGNNTIIRGLLLNDGFRKAGSMKTKDGKDEIKWPDGYVVTLLSFGGSRSTDVRRLTVRSGLEDTIKKQLENANWGSVIDVEIENNRIVSLEIQLDWISQLADI